MTVLLEDTRQQGSGADDKHATKHECWAAAGVEVVRSKLAWGDYCLPPAISVDTKRSIAEMAQNIDQQHERFRREMVGARDAGVQLVVLVENEDGVDSLAALARWQESDAQFAKRKNAQRRLDGMRLAKACATMQDRYGVRFEFCAPEDAARRVVEILTEGGGGGGQDDGRRGS